jgi:anti-anti-sigma factor
MDATDVTDAVDGAAGAVLRLEPELTIYGAAALRQTLVEALSHPAAASGGTAPLVLDLADVCDIDSAGVQLLMAARRHADVHGLPLLLRAHSASVHEAFALFGLDDQARGAHHDT